MFKKKFFSIFIILFTVCVMQLVFVEFNKVYATSKVNISSKSKTLQIGYGMKLNIYGTGKKVKWHSSDDNIASVTGAGYVTANSVGETTVKGKVGNKTYKCKIYVKKNAHVEMYNTKKLAFEGVNSNVKYKSSDSKIASIDKKGKVTGKKTGNVKITAKVNGKKYSLNLIVDASRLENRCKRKLILL